MEKIQEIRWDGLEADILRGENYSGVNLYSPRRSLSSAVLRGGLASVRSVLNLKVQPNPAGYSMTDEENWESPDFTLTRFSESLNLPKPVAGMMTSAHMESFRLSVREESWGGVYCLLTAGIANALAAGDAGEFHPEVKGASLPTGTINIITGTNLSLTDAALAEAIMIITEAKTATLADKSVKSTLSGRPATGTGTDSVLISSGNGRKAAYCGKHTKLGQLIGEAVREALSSSLDFLVLSRSDNR